MYIKYESMDMVFFNCLYNDALRNFIYHYYQFRSSIKLGVITENSSWDIVQSRESCLCNGTLRSLVYHYQCGTKY